MQKEIVRYTKDNNIIMQKGEDFYLFLSNFWKFNEFSNFKWSYLIELIEGKIKVILNWKTSINIEDKNNLPNNVFVSSGEIAEIIALSENAVCKTYETK